MKATLKCGRCGSNALAGLEDEVVTLVRCPNCDNEVSGEQANHLYLEEARYLAFTMAQEEVFGDFKPIKSKFVNVTLTPAPKPPRPDWEFYLDPNE